MFSIEFDDNWSFGKNPNEYFAFSLKRYHVKRWINGAESVYHVLHLIWLDTQVSCSFRPMLNVHPFVIQSYAIALIWLDLIRFGSIRFATMYTHVKISAQRDADYAKTISCFAIAAFNISIENQWFSLSSLNCWCIVLFNV